VPSWARWQAELLQLFFDVLQSAGAEFGYRSATEATRFIAFHKKLSGQQWSFDDAFDAQVVQRLLPKLNGARNKLEPVLSALGQLCHVARQWAVENGVATLTNRDAIAEFATRAMAEEHLHPLAKNDEGHDSYSVATAQYKMGFEKIRRMLPRANPDVAKVQRHIAAGLVGW
jgi:hypothetical protein